MDPNGNKTHFDGNVPYVVHESALARFSIVNKRLVMLCILLLFALICTNAAWLYYESQFTDQVTVTQDTPDGNNSYIGHDGEISYGASDYND